MTDHMKEILSKWVDMRKSKEAAVAFATALKRQEVEEQRSQIRLVVDNTKG